MPTQETGSSPHKLFRCQCKPNLMPSQWRANPLSTLSQSWSTSHTSKPHIRGMALDWHYIGNKSPNSRLVASLVGEQSSRQTDVIPLQANLSLQHKFSNWPIRSNPVSMCQCVTIRPIQKQFTNPLLKHHTACLSGKVDPHPTLQMEFDWPRIGNRHANPSHSNANPKPFGN